MTTKKRMKRASSTSLRTWDECKRKAVFEYGPDPRREEATFAMGVGTVAHAILEWRTIHGETPTEADVRTMTGNYDDPSVVLDAYADEGIWDVALNSVDLPELHDPRSAILAALDIPADAKVIREEVELPLADFGITFPSTPSVAAEGYIDHFLHVEGVPPIIFDWKVRGRLDYAPKTDAEFRADTQQTYYPAVVQRALGCDSVIVAHGNILRTDRPGKQKFVPYHAEMDAWFLRASFAYYDGVVEEMVAAMAVGDPMAVDRTEGRCWKYNKACPHLRYCKSGGKEYKSALEWAREAYKARGGDQ